MPVLSITHADLKRLCAIASADTSSDSELDALIAAEQPAHEYALDPALLTASAADTGLGATLTLGVAETMAGSFLRQQARATGFTDDFHVGPLEVTASRTDSVTQLGERLSTQGEKRLEPFARAAKRVAYDASGGVPDGSSKAPLLAQADVTGSVFDLPFGCDLPFGDGNFGDGNFGNGGASL